MHDFKRGDHLITPRTGYSHHGLYLGNNQVIHYTGFSHGQHHGAIAITNLDEFSQGEGFTVQTYPFRLYSHAESADRACSRLGEDWYDVLLNNCEHFVTWCVLGIHSSHQVNRLIAAAALTRKLLTSQVAQETTRQLSPISTIVAARSASQAGTVMGIAAGTGVATGSTVTTALMTGITASAAAPLAATIGVGIAVGYGVKKLVDWVWD